MAHAARVCVWLVYAWRAFGGPCPFSLLLWALATVFLALSICLSDAGFLLSREGIGMGEGVVLPWPGPSSTYCTFQSQPFCVGYLFLEGKCLLKGCKLHDQGMVGGLSASPPQFGISSAF